MFVTLGVVSNVWGALLPTSSLREQCERAAAQGYGYVELRQRALAECEETVAGDGRPWPLPAALGELRAAFPHLRFNLAVEAAFLTEALSGDDAYLRRCIEAAAAVGAPDPVLRLVDVSPAPTLLKGDRIEELAGGVATLAREAAGHGVRLALENSRQPLLPLRSVIHHAGAALGSAAPRPQVCWDPMNQLQQQFVPDDPLETVRELPPDQLFMFHFKQSADGTVIPEVREGDLDWHRLLKALYSRGYRGPALFEIAPGEDIWERLDRSTHYVRELIRQVEQPLPGA